MLIVEPLVVEHVSEIQSVMKVSSSMEPPQTTIEKEIWQLNSNKIMVNLSKGYVLCALFEKSYSQPWGEPQGFSSWPA
jgi:hypothetical protein